jgi:hypothetical protein
MNEQADSPVCDFRSPWLDPMAKEGYKVFAQDMRGNLKVQKAGEVPSWKQSFERPSAIQQRAIVPVVQGNDVIAQPLSGTGKSATFSISILQQVRSFPCSFLFLSNVRLSPVFQLLPLLRFPQTYLKLPKKIHACAHTCSIVSRMISTPVP